jgi:hypothetical protein
MNDNMLLGLRDRFCGGGALDQKEKNFHHGDNANNNTEMLRFS